MAAKPSNRPLPASRERGEIERLLAAYAGGGEARSIEVRNVIAEAYIPLVTRAARVFARKLPDVVEPADLEADGVFGLFNAIDRFDPGRGAKFWTFAAPRVRGAMIDGLRNRDYASRLMRKRGTAPVLTSMAATIWDDGSGKGLSLADELVAPEPAEAVLANQRRDVREMCRVLDARSRSVVELYYVDGLTMREIGDGLGVSESRVSQMHSAALRLLRAKLTPADA